MKLIKKLLRWDSFVYLKLRAGKISEHYPTVSLLIIVKEQRSISNDHLSAPVFYLYELIV